MTHRTLWQLAVLLLPIESAALLAALWALGGITTALHATAQAIGIFGAAAGTVTTTAATLLTLAVLAALARRIASIRAADRAALQDRRRARARREASR